MSTLIKDSSNDSSFLNTKGKSMTKLAGVSDLLGRILLSTLFLLSGAGKITAYAATAGYMASMGVPPALLPLTIALEIGGAFAIILGWQTRVVSLALASFTVVAGVLFHRDFSDQIQMVMFLKNVSIAGGFLLLAVNGAGPLSLDARKVRRGF